MTDQTLALKGLPSTHREAGASSRVSCNGERRGLFNRRLPDRRSSDNRINAHAPRRSRLTLWSCWALSATVTVFFLIVIAGEVLYQRPLYPTLAVTGALVALSAIAFMLGLIEQRLIEIRLELMMANGGGRSGDRPDVDWSGGPDRRRSDRQQADRKKA